MCKVLVAVLLAAIQTIAFMLVLFMGSIFHFSIAEPKQTTV